MNDQELKDLWRQQKIADAPPVNDTHLDAMRKKTTDLHACLRGRNLGEYGASVFVAIVFGIYYFWFTQPLARLGSLLVIAGVAFASWKLSDANRRAPRPDPAAPMTQWLQQERARIHHEAELLRTVFWWYIFPIGLGTNVFCWGLALPGLAGIAIKSLFTCGTILLYIWIYKLNQSARRKKLLPIRDELDALIQDPNATIVPAEAPATSAATKAKLRNNFLWAGLILAATFAVLFFIDKARETAPALPPTFTDISGFKTNDLAKIDAYLQEQIATSKFPSLTVAIVHDGQIAYLGAFGYQDVKARRVTVPQTSYHVASVTKAFTASLAAILHVRGVIDLDQPAIKYLPKGVTISTKPQLGATITLRQLAAHTSGLPRGIPGPVQSVEGRYELEPNLLYNHLANLGLASDPGTAELYSNLAFGLLGHILELAAKKPYAQLLQENILDPLQLTRTAIEGSDRAQKLNIATGYTSASSSRPATHSLRERLAPSGGLVTTPEDLAKFMIAQMSRGHFTREMLFELFTPTKLKDGTSARHTLGWTIDSRGPLRPIFKKNGGRNNTSAFIAYAPLQKAAIAIISNTGSPDVDQLGMWLLERSVGAEVDTKPSK